jgi:hypothetical protein
MPRPSPPAPLAALALLAATSACSRGGGVEARAHLEARDRAAAPAPFEWQRPEAALAMTADEAAARLGSFEWSATVSWTVTRSAAPAPPPAPGEPTGTPPEPLRVRAAERHHLRQLRGGDFHLLAEIDPGTWSGAETGKEVVLVGGTTWARERYAPFRERPTDRGRDARRFRDESFRLAADLARLVGPGLQVQPRGEGVLLGRGVRRFALLLRRSAAGAAPPPTAGGPAPADEDTRLRAEFLEGRVPTSLEGEMQLDAGSGVPLLVRIRLALGERGDPRLRAEVALEARVTGLGAAVAAVAPPGGALPDDRKPPGVARALERAGLRKRGETPEKEKEPRDEALDEE